MWLLIAGVIALVLLKILCSYLERVKCPNCKSRKVYELSREELDSEPKLFKETVRIKEFNNTYNSKTNIGQRAASNQYINPPSKIITQEVIVEGKRVWYKVRCKCAKCNNEFLTKVYVDKKPQIKQ